MFFYQKLRDLEWSLTFEDVLVKPAYSSIVPSEVDLSISLRENLILNLPILSAAMDTITGYEMSRAMIENGCCGPLHKNNTFEKNLENIRKLRQEFPINKPIAISVSANEKNETIDNFVAAKANIIIVDSAHGHSKNVGNLVEYIKNKHKDIFVIAGNVVTKEGAKFLIDKGADAIKVGIGPGSICTTRKVTGIGRGQVSSIAEVADYCKKEGILTVADGGMKGTDDIVKALSCGADLVMLGYMLAGCNECSGKEIEIQGEKYKQYRGMGSLSSMKAGSASRYNKDSISGCKWIPEGIEGYVKAKGPVKNVLHEIEWSLKSAFGYVGAQNIKELHQKANFVRINRSSEKKTEIKIAEPTIPTL